MVMIALRILVALLGVAIVIVTFRGVIRTFVLPRSANDSLTRFVFRCVRIAFLPATRPGRSFIARDAAQAMYAPVGLLALLVFWLAMVLFGYMGIFWALDPGPWGTAFKDQRFRPVHPRFLGHQHDGGIRDLIHGSGSWIDPRRAAHFLPADNVRGVLEARGGGNDARSTCRRPPKRRDDDSALQPPRASGEVERVVARVGNMVRGTGGNAYIARRPRVFSFPESLAFVDHGGRRGAGCNITEPLHPGYPL